jgi:putative colanic acid biosysnthesis UDP-glucose lipid carrier transferase
MKSALFSMFERHAAPRIFSSAPLSVSSVVAAWMQPALTVAALLLTTTAFDGQVELPDVVLCLLAFALSFPGPNRFKAQWPGAGIDILLSWAFVLTVLMLFGWLANGFQYFKTEVLVTWALVTPWLQWSAVAVGRAVLRSNAAQPAARCTALLVGGGPLGMTVARALQRSSDHRVELLGCFDDRGADRLHTDASTRLLGGLDELAPYVREHGIKEVYITLPLSSKPRIVELLESMQGTTASIFFVPDMVGVGIIQGRLQDMAGFPVVGICETPFTGINKLVKRFSDVVLATLILVAISPLMLVIAIAVKLSSPGPAIFKQRRNGLYGDEFSVYKFRSMTTQDDGAEVVQAIRGDARVTPLGHFLRRTSLDELPQFFNVLQGSMSIVGPRPHAVAHNEQYRQIIKAYMVRHKVKPGITGWAQVNGLRGQTDTVEKMKARVEYDLEYLRNWSIGLDLGIILRTIRIVLFDRGAY